MTQFDHDKLRDALNERDDSVVDRIGQTFLRNARWLMIIGWFKSIMFVAIAVFAAFRFFHTDLTRSQIAWASVFVVATLSTGFMFAMYWLELNRNSVLRELKRLELQIAELGARH